MSTTMQILNPNNQRAFNSPPDFGSVDRQIHFELNDKARKYMKSLRTDDNKVSFIIQYGYFNAKGRFFEASQFRKKDINYIYRIFGFPSTSIPSDKSEYQGRYGGPSSIRHRKKILEIKGWQETGTTELESLAQFANWETTKQAAPTEMLYALFDQCWKMRWVVPSYDRLASIISQCYLQFETSAIAKIESQLTQTNKEKIEQLLLPNDTGITLLARVKRIDQSTRTLSLKQNAEYLSLFKDSYFSFEKLINDLDLTDSAISYYSDWVLSAKTFQLKQFKNRDKTYLYLLGFIKHQFYLRQDASIKGIIATVRKSINRAKKKAEEYERKHNAEKNKAIDAVSDSQKRYQQMTLDIIRIADDSSLSPIRKVEIIRNLAIDTIDGHDDNFIKRSNFLDDYREKERKDLILINALKEESRSLSLAIGETLQLLTFDEVSSNPPILQAIHYFQDKKGKITNTAPTSFMHKNEKRVVFENGRIITSLYKMFLYRHIVDHIKSGNLSLKYSYEYRSLDDYMIDREIWGKNKTALINDAGLSIYSDCRNHLDTLKDQLENRYTQVNKRINKGENGYLKPRVNGRFHVNTPAIEYDQSKYISSVLSNEGEVPIMQVLKETNRACQFTDLFTHHSNRNTAKEITPELAIAGIMGLGCNIGTRKMAKKSIGINDNALVDTVNWRFTNNNLNKINKKIVDEIELLKLPNIFKVDENCLLSSSDGKKVTVSVDSLLANYSYKYYGKERGVAIYSFINEKQTLFHSTVFSSSDREAIYLLDGLLHNTTPIQHIHTTDTHGYTEAIFAATHLIDISFAPRFKRVEDQVIYSFHTKDHYRNQNYRLLPSRRINRKLIEDNWDDIMRFMASVKLGHTSASQLFKRLNSYSKDHPLYKALKEFGRILKSLHILAYYDDLDFRQKIQKQLNRVELSNKFSDAVFWDRGQQFHVATKEEQEQYTLCKVIIQNAIIFWNYLFLSDRLMKARNPQDKEDMIDSIMKGSVLTWTHINFTGEYDFTKPAAKDFQFNHSKLKKLEVPTPKAKEK